MAKQAKAPATPPAPAVDASKTNADYIKDAMQALGRSEETSKKVYEWLKAQYPGVSFSENSITQGCSKVRAELGWGQARGTTAAPKVAVTATLNDLDNAEDLLQTLQMDAAKLLEVVKEVNGFGDLAVLELCLERLIKFKATVKRP